VLRFSRLAVWGILLWTPVDAGTILSVGGSTSAYFNLGPQVLATSLTTTMPYTGVSFFATLFDNTANDASGIAYLTRAIGPSATPSSLVDQASFTIGAGATNIELLTEPMLSPGTYYLVLTGTSSPSDFGWLYTPSPILFAGPGVIEGQRFYANPGFNPSTALNPAYPPGSTFANLDNPSDRLLFSVISADIPEPATAVIFPALLGLMAVARKRTGRGGRRQTKEELSGFGRPKRVRCARVLQRPRTRNVR
jgi:hypothetical protein